MNRQEEEHLQHYGVLGMKWGVRRDRLKKSNSKSKAEYKSGKIDKNQHKTNKRENYHKSKGQYSPYKVAYDQHRRSGNSRKAAQQKARIEMFRFKAASAVLGTHVTMVGARKAARRLDRAMTPDNIRKGKNIIQSMKGSKFRYADASKMTNLVRNGQVYTRALKQPAKLLGR